MSKGRLEAFSDGVLAVIITIMVLELRPPHGVDPEALRPLVHTFVSYVLSFVFIAIYWNNHHHMLQATRTVSGAILWANVHLLFWLSLVPFVTAWFGESNFASWPAALYGFVMLMAGTAYTILARMLIRRHGPNSTLAAALGEDVKGRMSLVLYGAAIPLAFLNAWISLALYVTVAAMWLIPDRRIERLISSVD